MFVCLFKTVLFETSNKLKALNFEIYNFGLWLFEETKKKSFNREDM